jgi:hypothetical protein
VAYDMSCQGNGDEKPLLPSSSSSSPSSQQRTLELVLMEEEETELGEVVFRASFETFESNYVNYRVLMWVGFSTIMILAYGLGLVMLLYTPMIAYIARKDIQATRLYITSENVVVKVCSPCSSFSQSITLTYTHTHQPTSTRTYPPHTLTHLSCNSLLARATLLLPVSGTQRE